MAHFENDEDLAPKANPILDADDLDVEFGDENTVSKSDGLDKILPEKNRVARFALLTDLLPAKKAWVHYIENKGSYRCLSKRDKKGVIIGEPAVCCKKTDGNDKAKAGLIVAALALQYTNANQKDGKYYKTQDAAGQDVIPPIDYEVRWVKLSRSGFRRVSNLVMDDEKIVDFDLKMSWKDGNGVGFEYNKVALKCRFRQNPELVAEVQEAVKPFLDGVLLTKKLGKVVSLTDMAALFAGQNAQQQAPAGADVSCLDDM